MTKRKPIYDRLRAEAHEQVAALDANPDEWGEVIEKLNVWLTEVRASGTHHLQIAVGDGPGLCVTCGTKWPCKPARAEYPRVGG